MLRSSLMASTILFATATRGGNKSAFDPGIEAGDLVDKTASLGFEGAMCYLHVRIVPLHYGNVKKKRELPSKSLSERFLNPQLHLTPSLIPSNPLLPHVTERLHLAVDLS